MNDDHKLNCEFGREIVPYLYAELGDSERTRFETHLADCMECTDEFAGISHARFSVLEWQLGEFAEMPTPKIVIPYGPRTVTAGWFAGVREMLTLPGWGSAVAVAALLLMMIGAGYIYLDRRTTLTPEVASFPVVAGPAVVQQVNETAPLEGPATEPSVSVQPAVIRPVRARVAAKKTPAKALTAKVADDAPVRSLITDRPVQKTPVLSNFDDEDDRSLRLADLLDDSGAGS